MPHNSTKAALRTSRQHVCVCVSPPSLRGPEEEHGSAHITAVFRHFEHFLFIPSIKPIFKSVFIASTTTETIINFKSVIEAAV